MKKSKLTLLSLAIFCPSFASAAEAASQTEGERSALYQFMENPLFADSKVDLTFRNMWKYLKTDTDADDYKTIAQAWGQGIALDYKSGYLADFIGFDLSYYGAIKLAASDNFSSRAVLYNNNGDAEGYNKIGQRYVKFKLDVEPVRFDVHGGWQVLKNVGILTSSTRLSINSYQGWYGKMTVDNFLAEVAYVTGTSRRDSPDKVRLNHVDGRHLDHVWTGGLTYKNKDMTLAYFYGDADNYIRQQGLETRFKLTPQVTLNTQIYNITAQDKHQMQNVRTSKRAFDDDAWHYSADIKWQPDVWSLKFGMAYTDANKRDGLGYYPRNVIGNSRGRFNGVAYADIDYMRDGELYFTGTYDYQLTADHLVGIQAMYGQLDYKDNTVRSGALQLFHDWQPTDIKNFSIYSYVGYGWHYKNSNRTPILDSQGHYRRSHSLSGSMTAVYRFNLL